MELIDAEQEVARAGIVLLHDLWKDRLAGMAEGAFCRFRFSMALCLTPLFATSRVHRVPRLSVTHAACVGRSLFERRTQSPPQRATRLPKVNLFSLFLSVELAYTHACYRLRTLRTLHTWIRNCFCVLRRLFCHHPVIDLAFRPFQPLSLVYLVFYNVRIETRVYTTV